MKIEENRPIAQWILDPDGMDWNIPAWRCSRCGCINRNIEIYVDDRPQNPFRWSGSKYCPECGAKIIWYKKGYEKANDKSTKSKILFR